MLLVRTLFHALLLLTALVIIDTLTRGVPGVQLVLNVVRIGHYLLFSFSTAAALNRQRLLVPVVMLLAVLFAYPLSIDVLVHMIVTAIVGVVSGTLLQGLIHEGTHHAPAAQPRSHSERRPPADPDHRSLG